MDAAGYENVHIKTEYDEDAGMEAAGNENAIMGNAANEDAAIKEEGNEHVAIKNEAGRPVAWISQASRSLATLACPICFYCSCPRSMGGMALREPFRVQPFHAKEDMKGATNEEEKKWAYVGEWVPSFITAPSGAIEDNEANGNDAAGTGPEGGPKRARRANGNARAPVRAPEQEKKQEDEIPSSTAGIDGQEWKNDSDRQWMGEMRQSSVPRSTETECPWCDSHENAAMSICQLNGYKVNGRPLKCRWAMETCMLYKPLSQGLIFKMTRFPPIQAQYDELVHKWGKALATNQIMARSFEDFSSEPAECRWHSRSQPAVEARVPHRLWVCSKALEQARRRESAAGDAPSASDAASGLPPSASESELPTQRPGPGFIQGAPSFSLYNPDSGRRRPDPPAHRYSTS
ncbi:Uu.00g094510.m01.CDS01 [Anthostomella pinea]|uniref:Uu.00g094510.m01.CDS01 n=1 Tax=Anthostomella pinea TaxID=933095 RepID=A0AAI8YKN1_9PEZI|nr:Uu.00g094510.m01.CDS01 [Anthostomella pinea]